MNKSKHSIFYCKDLPRWFVAINIIGLLPVLLWLPNLYLWLDSPTIHFLFDRQLLTILPMEWTITFLEFFFSLIYPLILLAIVAFSFKLFRKKKIYGILCSFIPIIAFITIVIVVFYSISQLFGGLQDY